MFLWAIEKLEVLFLTHHDRQVHTSNSTIMFTLIAYNTHKVIKIVPNFLVHIKNIITVDFARKSRLAKETIIIIKNPRGHANNINPYFEISSMCSQSLDLCDWTEPYRTKRMQETIPDFPYNQIKCTNMHI